MIALQPSLLQGLADTDQPNLRTIREKLQLAVELEHSTLPPYLYALYSLVPGKNDRIAEIIQSVAFEEMLHMTLACNLINALGGSPTIDAPGFIPIYPGPLPGGVESQLCVSLAPFSMDQLETFLTIEKPEDPIEFEAFAATTDKPVTIGMFYDRIKAVVSKLPDSDFTGNPSYQIGPDLMPESVVVTDATSAVRAIDIIVDQGEGTETSPQEVEGGDFAHYYRYMEIKMGRELVKVPGTQPPDKQYTYTGDPVPFDPSGVYPIPTDPKAAKFAEGTPQRLLLDNFNYTYTSLLKVLHSVFNGQPQLLNGAVGLMMSLKEQAKAMSSGLPNPNPTGDDFVGPSFEYTPVNPSSAG